MPKNSLEKSLFHTVFTGRRKRNNYKMCWLFSVCTINKRAGEGIPFEAVPISTIWAECGLKGGVKSWRRTPWRGRRGGGGKWKAACNKAKQISTLAHTAPPPLPLRHTKIDSKARNYTEMRWKFIFRFFPSPVCPLLGTINGEKYKLGIIKLLLYYLIKNFNLQIVLFCGHLLSLWFVRS